MSDVKLSRGLPRIEPQKKVQFDPRLEEVEADKYDDNPVGYLEPVGDMDGGAGDRRHGAQETVLKAVGVAISCGAAFVSWFNSFEWFAGLRPVYIAVPMALTMVGASVLMPDFGILLMKQGRKVLGLLILGSGIIATAFGMVTTVAALYNTKSDRMTVDGTASTALASSLLADKEAERARLAATLEQDDALILDTQGKIALVSTDETVGANSQVLQRRLNGYLDRKTKDAEALKSVESEIAKLRERGGSANPREDFYSFTAGIFGADTPGVEFFISAVPAVFLEIVAPVMVAVVLFL